MSSSPFFFSLLSFFLINILYKFFFLLSFTCNYIKVRFFFFLLFYHYICFFILFLNCFVLNNCINVVVGFVFHMRSIFSNCNFIFFHMIFLVEFIFLCYLFVANLFFFFFFSKQLSFEYYKVLIYINLIIL